MNIIYKETKNFVSKELEDLFLSVNCGSGKHPDKLVKAMKNSSHVIAAYDNDKLVGLVRSLDDGETVAFIHYLLVNPSYQAYHIGTELMTRLLEKYKDMLHIKIMPSNPKVIPFYERLGFKIYDNYTAMEIMRL